MGKRLVSHLLVQLVVVAVVGATAGLCALVSMGGIGGTAMGVAPEFSFGLVADMVCPEGTLEYYSVQRSYHEPGESEPHVECVGEDGEREDVLFPAVLAVLGLTFAGGFVIAFLPAWVVLALVGWFVTRRVMTPEVNFAVGQAEGQTRG